MSVIIDSVKPGSPCFLDGIRKGDVLLTVDGNEIFDVLDYDYFCSDGDITLRIEASDGVRTVYSKSPDAGLGFETYLMDKKQSCRNKCIFCFVDQMPAGMRESLYFKDDDSRLSFLFGNYITLTGISEREVKRIISMHISPVNISVHTMNPELRVAMMKNPAAGKRLDIIRRFAEGGVAMNTQLVLCPGYNDNEELEYSLNGLWKYYPAVQSIAVVPVGITKYRENLPPLRLFTAEEAAKQIAIVDRFNASRGHIAYCSDEFYLAAGIPVPDASYYNDYCQIENGVGMWRSLSDEFYDALGTADGYAAGSLHIATGVAARPLLSELSSAFAEKFPQADITVHGIVNDFFGHSVTVAGLLTARDIIAQLSGKVSGTLVIPSCMLKTPQEPVFLDDVSVGELSDALGVKVIVTDGSGYDLCDIFSGERTV